MSGLRMKKQSIDPGLLERAELERWYRRTPDEIEAERDVARMRRSDEFFGWTSNLRTDDDFRASERDQSEGGWRQARMPIGPAIQPPPVETRAGAPDTASAPLGAGRDGFFGTYEAVPNPLLGPAYYTDLPRPLNIVTPRFSGWFELGDGTFVQGADEVERIHSEQRRRMRGEVYAEPLGTVGIADRLEDGVIPTADQIEKRQGELDATCHPYGGWERDPGFKEKTPKRSQRYEAQITHAPGLDYVVRNPGERPVKFDGCAVWDPRHQFLEAKGPGYAGLVERGRRWSFFPSLKKGTGDQAGRQARASGGRSVDWHIAEPDAVPYFAEALAPYPWLKAQHTPAR